MIKNKYNKIAIIGKSPKFITEIKKNYSYKKLDVISWREAESNLNRKSIVYDFIFVCGFNFNIFLKNQFFFEKKNIFIILKLLKKISNNKTLIIYINTQQNINKNYTFSRYKYAKHKLAHLIFKKFKNIIVFNSDLIKVGNDISINSNFFSKFIFYIFSKLNLMKTIEIKEIFLQINNMIKINNHSKPKNIKGIFLKIPRTQLVDRILRLILG